ncbi:MAG: 4Fe-4S dicluster domain-containing protein, partial [Acidobacteria bacterium]|nr:4Fe-4S dicluster domain-containing protein [Acidobacteriota bacterium]
RLVRPSAREVAVRSPLCWASALAMWRRSNSAIAALSGGGSSLSWIGPVAKDLRAHSGSSVVVAGEHLPPAVHEAVHQINQILGNVGQTVLYREPSDVRPVNQVVSLRELVNDMHAGEVEVLVIIGGNPVYGAPADLKFADALANVPFRAHMSIYYDETSERCDWHLPASHFLESWSDARSFDGTESIVQPLIEPLYDGHTAHELLAIFTGDLNATAYDLVRDYWQGRVRVTGDFEKWWRRVLHDGVIPPGDVAPATFSFPSEGPVATMPAPSTAPGEYEVVFRPDPAVYDGRFANNGWLQEMPKPLTKITWDNAALVSPATARALGVTTEDVIEVEHRGGKIHAPVWITPGHAPSCITLFLGYGRTKAGRVGSGLGYDANLIRTSESPWIVTDAQVRKIAGHYELASTQRHFRMHGRNLVRAATFDQFQRDPHLSITELSAHEPGEAVESLSLYGDAWDYPGYAWGMSVDTSVCTGCGGCVVACVAENNIPVVGKKEVIREREMHWLRIDRYYQGDAEKPHTFHQPVLCMHCENAPCEPVCPVEATSHSHEGLNDMTYNRCVGTRYCSNNCPYKVRRFNFFQYSDWDTPSLKLGRNPDVTVRSRGVMEKCTYCVQRINTARIDAQRDDRQIRDGEIRTACEQSCPTQAIVFGNINDPESRVAKLKHEAHDYSLLEEINTRPRTTYLATIRNLNPEISQT